ncbi:MAG: hypothetical protein RLZZ196_2239 [Bacteroidota bacterium]|jgi:hypothetical protein
MAKENKEQYVVADCIFVVMAILPNGNIHRVIIDSDEVADLIVDIGKFQVEEEPLGFAMLDSVSEEQKKIDRRNIN